MYYNIKRDTRIINALILIERRIIIDKILKRNFNLKKNEITNQKKYLILIFYALSLIVFGFLVDTPINIGKGLYKIVIEPDILITDYIGVGGIGATFFNAGLLMLLAIFMLYKFKININGVAITCTFLIAGFSMFGKNIFNVWFIIIGVYLYAKVQKDKFSKYIYIALLGTCLSPMVTQIMFGIDKPLMFRVMLGTFIGLMIGFILPPLSVYMMRIHQGYNLYNIGFVSGMIGTILVSIFKSYGFLPQRRMIWTTDHNMVLAIYLFLIFSSMILIGFYLNDKSFKNLKNIFSYPGRAITDFVMLEGFEITLINMGMNGFIGLTYIFLVKGDLNGPVIGGIFTLVGFGAFGKHFKNMIPIFAGVFLGSLTKMWSINDPAIVLAALFGTTLAPIAGEFGWKYGVLAGFIHSSVVLNVGILHGGFNLYNNGFAGGIVAATLLPIIEAFRKE